MTNIVPFQPPTSNVPTTEFARQAWTMASHLSGTEFVPTALRGKPEAVLACMLAGHEAGVGPMQALAKIHVVEGRPAMAAELMRALALRAGHEIWIEASSATSVTICASRAGSDRVSRITWTMDDARAAGLAGRNNWRKYPRAMLTARATSEICRLVFPDVLAGISHTIEELTDGDVDNVDLGPVEVDESIEIDDGPATTTRRSPHVAAAGGSPTPQETPGSTPRSSSPRPPLPGAPTTPPEPENATQDADEFDDVVDAEVVDEDEFPPDPDPDPIPDDHENGPRLSGGQLVAMKLGDRGIRERDARLRIVSHAIGRDISSGNDLTPDEVSTVVAWLDEQPDDAILLAGQAPDNEDVDAYVEAMETRPTAVSTPNTWDADRWRQYAKTKGVSVIKLLREARRLAAELDPPETVGTVDDIVGSDLVDDLVAYLDEAGS